MSLGGGYPGDAESSTLPPKRVAQFRPTGICDDLPDGGVSQATRYEPYDANGEQRFQIALALKTIRDWVGGCSEYRPLRLLTAGVAGTGKSFVIHFLTDLVRKLLGFPRDAMVYAPTGVAAFQAGGPTGHSLLKLPTGKKAFGQLEPLKGESLRKAQGDLSRRALLIGGGRGVVGRSMLLWKEYNSPPIAPISREAHSSASRGGRPVVNLLGADLQLPPALDSPCYDRSERGPAANRGLSVRDGFEGAVVLREILRQGEGDATTRGALARLWTYRLTDGCADWLMSLQLDKLPKGKQKWVEENGLYLFSTHKEEWAWNMQKLRHLNDIGGRPVANIAAENSGIHSKDAPP